MAIDKLDTLKQEFNTVKRQLHIQSAEVQQLKALVARSSNTLGQVELEHDFYRANACWRKTTGYVDLCREWYRKIPT